jgi:ABC-2 type transport system permease protein
MLALAVIATGLVSLGIATAYERYYGVLKRLGATPLPRGGLLVAKALSIVGLEVLQVVILVAVAAGVYGWRPAGNIGVAVLAFVLGTIAFAGLGLAMAGALRAEATLAGANALFLILLLLSGAILPLDHLPELLQGLARVLPAAALATALRDALTGASAFPGAEFLVLAIWAVLTLAVAARTFQWE